MPGLRDIREVAATLGLGEAQLSLSGRSRAKMHLDLLDHGSARQGKYVLISSTTPTPLGEGKTVTAIGLSMALARQGKTAAVAIRQSSLGPSFGAKGGGAGGGRARIEPLEECLLGLGGDTYAVESANNLLAAFIDDALLRRAVPLDPIAVTWRRVVDVDDRALRHVVIGLGGRQHGVPRETGFDITAASEVMAILALSRDLGDLRRRLGAIVVGVDPEGRPVTAEGLRCAGAMAALLRDALQPNLMQTSEGTPAVIHTGPFGNISHGSSSVIADLLVLPRVDYLVAEAGFGAEMGAEKFFHIKCAASGLVPDATVLVTTVPGLRSHAGPASAALHQEGAAGVEAGSANLAAQIRNLRAFGVPVVVAINRFPTDTEAELQVVRTQARAAGAVGVAEHTAFAHGGEGCLALAEAVQDACRQGTAFRPLYSPEAPPRVKLETLATRLYGAAAVSLFADAERDLACYVSAGYGSLPVCVAKTPLSLSHDPALRGAPSGYTFPITGMRLAAGAGYLYALAGDIVTMPGLPGHPRAAEIDLDQNGEIVGLS